MEQSDEVNTLIDEVNKEYLFWHPHRDEEYPVDSNLASTKEEHHKDSNGVLDKSTKDEHPESLIGVLDGSRQDILNIESEN